MLLDRVAPSGFGHVRLVGRRKLAIWFAGMAFGGLGLALAAFLLLRQGPPFGDVRLAVWGMALGSMAAGVFCFVEGAVREVDVVLERSATEGGDHSGPRSVIGDAAARATPSRPC